MRVVDLENSLCEAQECQETLECEKEELAARLNVAEFNCKGTVLMVPCGECLGHNILTSHFTWVMYLFLIFV